MMDVSSASLKVNIRLQYFTNEMSLSFHTDIYTHCYHFEHEHPRIAIFQGTMLNPQDLQRVSAEKAAAVLVLCNKFSSDPSKNILSSANVLREYQEKDMTP